MSFLPTISSIFSPNTAYQTTITAVQYDEPAVDQTGDTVTISPEGLEAYQRIADAQMVYHEPLTLKGWKQADEETYQDFRTQHSAHKSIDAWANGESGIFDFNIRLGTFVQSNAWGFGISQQSAALAYSNAETALENVDEKISTVLKTNNIVLGKDETLNFSVNQDGKITVGEGIDETKRADIEKLLNEDKTLWRELVTVHGFRQSAEVTPGNRPTASLPLLSRAMLKQDVETVLQREYGVSLDDFVIKEATELGGLGLKLQDGSSELVEKIYGEEMALYESILAVKNSTDSFDIAFSYKNGVTVEKGINDQKTLDKIPEKVQNRIDAFDTIKPDYSITINSEGLILESRKLTSGGLDESAMQRFIQKANLNYMPSNAYLNQPVLQQYVVDMQRLTKFNTGAEADWGQITFGKAGGTAFSVAVK